MKWFVAEMTIYLAAAFCIFSHQARSGLVGSTKIQNAEKMTTGKLQTTRASKIQMWQNCGMMGKLQNGMLSCGE